MPFAWTAIYLKNIVEGGNAQDTDKERSDSLGKCSFMVDISSVIVKLWSYLSTVYKCIIFILYIAVLEFETWYFIAWTTFISVSRDTSPGKLLAI